MSENLTIILTELLKLTEILEKVLQWLSKWDLLELFHRIYVSNNEIIWIFSGRNWFKMSEIGAILILLLLMLFESG